MPREDTMAGQCARRAPTHVDARFPSARYFSAAACYRRPARGASDDDDEKPRTCRRQPAREPWPMRKYFAGDIAATRTRRHALETRHASIYGAENILTQREFTL